MWWSAETAGSRPPSCQVGRSPAQQASTPSSPDWLTRANALVVRTTKAAPVDLLAADQAAMLALPPIKLHLGPSWGWRNKIRLGRDYYVRLDTCDYSVDPTAIGALVDVAADLDRVRLRFRSTIPFGDVDDHDRDEVGVPCTHRKPFGLRDMKPPSVAAFRRTHFNEPSGECRLAAANVPGWRSARRVRLGVIRM